MRKYFFLCALLFATPVFSEAAYLYLDPAEATVMRGDTVTVSLRLDTDEGECINTVDGVITYEAGMRAVDVSRGDSILNLWVEDPKIDEQSRTITFAGGITGGYCGRAAGDPSLTNVIANIVFQSPGFAIGGDDDGLVLVSVSDTSSVLLNDGLGTIAPLRTSGTSVRLSPDPAAERTDAWREKILADTTPPSDFNITLTRDPSAFSGSYFVTWNTQDKQSGIDHYELMEEPLADLYAFTWGRADAPWVPAQSPHVLKDQTLNSTIRIKAIDKAGNETIAVLVPDEALRSLSQDRLITFALICGVVLIAFGLIFYALYARKRKIIEEITHDDA